jgi:fumarate hydratase subunit beta
MVRLSTPLEKSVIKDLRCGDKVLLSGVIYTARDMAHRYLIESLPNVPFELEGQVIYYTGPTPPKDKRPIGSCGPTTSIRMDPYTPQLLASGLRGMIGKGPRGLAVVEAIRKWEAVYFVAIGGAGVIFSDCVKECELVAYPELGTEAIYKLRVEDFPCYVGIDSQGNDILQKEMEALTQERTLVLIKPDGTQKKLIGEIIKRFESEGLRVCGLKMVQLDLETAGRFYQVHQHKPFYKAFIEFMSSGPSVAMVLEGKGAIRKARQLIGATDPSKAEWGTIRRDFATDIRYNIAHGSDSDQTAVAEINFFFRPEELY